ncbi:uncharacterized protein [Diadema antillarum]|uniref:uncharacterized protein n=1 Tax=Diadema antillarum TaxID=105358 RepID=UPI003A85B093
MVSGEKQFFAGSCTSPDGWESIGTGCYKYASSSYVDYDGAVTACSAIGGYPWVINDIEEISAVLESDYVRAGKLNHESIWIGCTDREVEGTFKCEDGSQFQAADVGWNGGWSQDTSRNCVAMSPAFPQNAPDNIECMPAFMFTYALCECESGVCPDEWESIGTGCYKFGSSSYVDYDAAVTACSAIGGYPWVINDNEERSAVLSSDYVATGKQMHESIWIGCTDREVEGTFKCADGSQFQGADGCTCPDGWESIGTGCYKYGSTSYVDYDDALTACNDIGGYPWVNNDNWEGLAVLASVYVIAGKQLHESIWIGCTDREVEGTFKCQDGSQFQGADGKK